LGDDMTSIDLENCHRDVHAFISKDAGHANLFGDKTGTHFA
jgi:hypothetical protein